MKYPTATAKLPKSHHPSVTVRNQEPSYQTTSQHSSKLAKLSKQQRESENCQRKEEAAGKMASKCNMNCGWESQQKKSTLGQN